MVLACPSLAPPLVEYTGLQLLVTGYHFAANIAPQMVVIADSFQLRQLCLALVGSPCSQILSQQFQDLFTIGDPTFLADENR